MAIRKDKVIVVDLEATCWQGYTAPDGQENEIIEIGVCLLDGATREISNIRSLYVHPIESEISPFCTALTGITAEMIAEQGMDFAQACDILEKEYDSRNRLWASWGGFDRKLFWEQCKRRGVRYPFSKKHSNLKRVFQDAVGTRMGLARAMHNVGLDMYGRQHSGGDDAWNTARLLRHLLQEHGCVILRKYGW